MSDIPLSASAAVSEGRPTAIIVGASAAGLTSAIALGRAGFLVEVVEDAFNPRAAGAAVVTPRTEEIYDALGVDVDRARPIVEEFNKDFGEGFAFGKFTGRSLQWGSLSRALRSRAADYADLQRASGTRAVSVEIGAPKPNITINTPERQTETLEADLVVLANGARNDLLLSSGRSGQPYAGYVTWQGEVPLRLLDDDDALCLLENTFYKSEGGGASFTAFVQTEPGVRGPRVFWTYCRPESEKSVGRFLVGDPLGTTDVPSFVLRFGGPAPWSANITKRALDHLRFHAADQLPPVFARVVASRANNYTARPGFDAVPTAMRYNGVAVVGDASFSGRPFSPESLENAAEDAIALGEELAQALVQGRRIGLDPATSISVGLDAFQTRRLDVVRSQQAAQLSADSELGLRSQTLAQRARILMDETVTFGSTAITDPRARFRLGRSQSPLTTGSMRNDPKEVEAAKNFFGETDPTVASPAPSGAIPPDPSGRLRPVQTKDGGMSLG